MPKWTRNIFIFILLASWLFVVAVNVLSQNANTVCGYWCTNPPGEGAARDMAYTRCVRQCLDVLEPEMTR